ncbi:MAG: hypothetical protein ACR2J4_08380, partial [Deinococcus sp.]
PGRGGPAQSGLAQSGLDGGGLDESVTFAVFGRSVLWLPSLEEGELARLRDHLGRFERELSEAVERTLHGEKGIRA